MPAGYTDAMKVGNYLGRTLTPDEHAQATWLVGVAEETINIRTGRSWLGVSPVVGERHRVYGTDIHLDYIPVLAVSSVSATSYTGIEDDIPLTVNSDWRLEDAVRGIVRIGSGYQGQLVKVTYTHGGPTLPATLELAATKLVANWLGADGASGLPGPESGIKSYSVGQDLSVTFQDNAGKSGVLGIPDDIVGLIDQHVSLSRVFA